MVEGAVSLYHFLLQNVNFTILRPTSSLLVEILGASLLCPLFPALFSVTTAIAVFCQIGEEKFLTASSFSGV